MTLRARRLLGFALLGGGLLSGGVGFRLRFPSDRFAAQSRIKIEQKLQGTNTYSAEFMQNEFELIQSEPLLDKVVASLNLTDRWSKRVGRKIQSAEALEILKSRLELRPVRCTSLVEIHFTGDDPAEAANICNAVAEEYRSHHPRTNSPVATAIVDTASAPQQAISPNRIPMFSWLGVGAILTISGIYLSVNRH